MLTAPARGTTHSREPDHDISELDPHLLLLHSPSFTRPRPRAPRLLRPLTEPLHSPHPPCPTVRGADTARPASLHQTAGKLNAGCVASCPRSMPPTNPVSSEITHESQHPKTWDSCACDNGTHKGPHSNRSTNSASPARKRRTVCKEQINSEPGPLTQPGLGSRRMETRDKVAL